MDHPLFVSVPRLTRDQLIAKLVEANEDDDLWEEAFMEKPTPVDQVKREPPHPFIFSPEQGWIRWGEPNGLHQNIENDLAMDGQHVPSDAFYGRYFPGDDQPVVVYDARFSNLPWDQQRRYRDLIYLNWPGQEWREAATHPPVEREGLPTMFPPPDRYLEEAKYFHQCPNCGGYLEKRGEDVYTCQSCPFELPYGGEHTAAPKIPSMRQLKPHRYDSECYEVARAIANQWPHLQEDAGFYVHPERGAGDHGWNIAPDGTIVDMTATQHDYSGPQDEDDWDEEKPFPVPEHPEIIPPDHPFYPRYVSWTRHEQEAQRIAHERGEHRTKMDMVDSCPLCYPQR